MKKTALFTACCLFVLLAAPAVFAKERVIVVSDVRMPFTGVPNAYREGYAVDALRAVFEERGFEVEYREQPWQRAVEDVRKGEADILLGATRSEVPGFIFSKRPYGEATMCFYTSIKGWLFTGPESLENVKTGLVAGHRYHAWLSEKMSASPRQFHVMHGEDALPRLIGMLKEKRVQAVPGNRIEVNYYIRTNDLYGEIFLAGCSREEGPDCYHFALSPANRQRSEALVKTLDEGMELLRKTGQMHHLLMKYGIDDRTHMDK